MDGITLQSRLWKGYGKAATRIGTPHGVYRPSGTTNPLTGGNLIATIPAVFSIHGAAQYSFDKPSDYKDNLFHGLFDATSVNQWDYLAGPAPSVESEDGVYFVAGLDPLKPILCVQCTRVFDLTRTSSVSGGVLTAASTTLFSGFPGGIILRGLVASVEKSFPEDSGSGVYEVLLPEIGSAVPQPLDILTDDIGRSYLVRTCEVSDLGWRIRAFELLSPSSGAPGSPTVVYSRVITIKRPNLTSGIGAIGYQGVTEVDETAIAAGLPAAIQLASAGRNTQTGELPADSAGPLVWKVFLPQTVMPSLPVIHERDVIYDDLGRRFQVTGFQPSPIEAIISAVRMLT